MVRAELNALPTRNCRASLANMDRPRKITFGEMRASGVRDELI
jgi:hypothetical protein